MPVRYLFFWLLLAVVAIGNGILRQSVYAPFVSALAAHQISTLTGIVFSGALVYWLNRKWPIASSRQAWRIGFCWLAMTIAFEFGFGHFVAGHPWSALLADYNLFSGRVWLLFLLWLLVLPYAVFRFGRR